jgi:uncharacterized protein YgfB (UPF0149 family)
MHKTKYMLSDWTKEGLKELGLSENKFNKMSKKEQKDLIKELKEMGHW